MWINYFKVALRNMWKHKFYSSINVFGLMVGMTTAILIFMYIADELSYDTFHKDADRIYRVDVVGRIANQEFNSANCTSAMASGLVEEVPEVESAVRIRDSHKVIVQYEDKAFTEDLIMLADSNFFSFFSFKLLQGSVEEALKGPNKVVLTESAATKYFNYDAKDPRTSPVGKILLVGTKRIACEVTGLAQDPPTNSHFTFTILESMDTWDGSRRLQWTNQNCYTY